MSSIMTWRVNESIEINLGIDVMNFHLEQAIGARTKRK